MEEKIKLFWFISLLAYISFFLFKLVILKIDIYLFFLFIVSLIFNKKWLKVLLVSIIVWHLSVINKLIWIKFVGIIFSAIFMQVEGIMFSASIITILDFYYIYRAVEKFSLFPLETFLEIALPVWLIAFVLAIVEEYKQVLEDRVKSLEEQVSKLENKIKFDYSVAKLQHELRTHLFSIKLALNMLEDKENIDILLEEINDDIEAMVKVLDELRIDVDNLRLEEVKVEEVIRNIINTMDLEIDLIIKESLKIKFNELLLRLLFLKILKNMKIIRIIISKEGIIIYSLDKEIPSAITDLLSYLKTNILDGKTKETKLLEEMDLQSFKVEIDRKNEFLLLRITFFENSF